MPRFLIPAPDRRSMVSPGPITTGSSLGTKAATSRLNRRGGKPARGPFVAVRYAVVVGEVRDLVQPRHPQCGGDGAPTGHEDRTHHQHHHIAPSGRGERVPERAHPFSPPARYVASSCARHSPIPESMLRGDSPISKFLRIARVITLDSIMQDSTQFSIRRHQRDPWLISLDGVLSASENGQSRA